VEAWFTLLIFKPRRISFVICFTTPSKVPIMFGFMGIIAFYTLSSLNSAWECHMPLFLAVFTLGYSRIHICTSDSCYVAPYIETSVDKAFSLASTLDVLNIKLNNGHVWLWENFDYTWSWSQYNIVEYMVFLDNVFYHN